MDGSRMTRGDAQRFGAIRGVQYGIALPSQRLVGHRANRGGVLDEEDGLGATMRCARGCRAAAGLDDRVYLRQVDLERRAEARFKIDPDESAALSHDAVDGRETEPGTLADFLGGEEGLEDPRLGCLVHPAAGVA